MGFKKVYKALQEIFPEVDSRILRAVAIEHCKDPETAVEVVLSEVIPCLTERKKPPGQSEVFFKSSEAIDANGSLHAGAAVLDHTKDSDEVQNGLSYYDASCGNYRALEGADGESLHNYHDAVGGEQVVVDGDGVGTPVSIENCMEKCDKSNGKLGAYESSQVTSVISNAEDRARDDLYKACGSAEATSFKAYENHGAEVAPNQISQLAECVDAHNTLEETDNSPCHDSTALMHKRIHEEVCLVEKWKIKHSEGQLDSLNVQTSTSSCSESSAELVVTPDVHNSDLEKAEFNDTIDASNKDLAGEMLVEEVECMPNPVVTASGQVFSIDLLEDMITEARSNKKKLFSAMESVICMMREVELQEEAAEQVKREAANGGLEMLRRVEDLKEMLRHAKEANDMHAGEVYGEKAILATEVKELQSRLLGLADDRDKSLAILDEMRQTIELRLAVAEKERKAAEEEKLAKEQLACKALADQELIMEKVVQESNILKQEAEENAKLREFLMDRGRVVDMLQGEISVICHDVRLLKEKFDDRVPLSKSFSSDQTSCILASSSSSLKSMAPDQVADATDLLDASEKMDTESNGEEASGDVTSAIHNKDLLDDGWEIFDNRELGV